MEPRKITDKQRDALHHWEELHYNRDLISNASGLKRTIKLLKRHKLFLTEYLQDTLERRSELFEEFQTLIENNSSVAQWNEWQRYVAECVASYKGKTFLLTEPDEQGSWTMSGAGEVGVWNGAQAYEQIIKDIRLGQEPPSNDLSERDFSYYPILSRIDLSGKNLREAVFRGTDLSEADLSGSNLDFATFEGANLQSARLKQARLMSANFTGANMRETSFFGSLVLDASFKRAELEGANFAYAHAPSNNFEGASLLRADFINADLRFSNLKNADLRGASFVGTDLSGADISGSRVYGVSVWDAKLDQTIQKDLIVTNEGSPTVTTDSLRLAQFLYLILESKGLEDAIEAISRKCVLLLGRFGERKEILDQMRTAVRDVDCIPLMFDFERPTSRDGFEILKTLAGMSLFMVVDLTEPMSSPAELVVLANDFRVPIKPIVQSGHQVFSMLKDIQNRHDHVLSVAEYVDAEDIVKNFKQRVFEPAMKCLNDLESTKSLLR